MAYNYGIAGRIIESISAKDAEIERLREALIEARGWVVLAEDFGRDTTRALALIDAALAGGKGHA